MLIATVAKMKFLLLVIVLIVFASPTLAGNELELLECVYMHA